MRGVSRFVVALVLFLGLVARAEEATRRWALVVGENHGLQGEETLRYAQDDAQRVRDALVEVGGVAPGDVTLVLGAKAETVRAALDHLKAALSQREGRKDRLFVYLSGHAGDGQLHLDGTELALSELVDFVKQAPVEVGVLVVDACRSGVMTRLKGLKPAEGPPVRVEASGLQGRVLISASGADEYAQESDELKGSTFTHHFVTGLRGAADSSRDGRVTLDEVYAWAWARTLESTFASKGGVQRPSFKVDLSGQGQLVLSEPGGAAGRLTIGVQAPGRWLLVGADSGAVVADLDKPEGPLTLAVAPGAYRLRLRVNKGVLERTVVVPATGGVAVRDDELERASLVRVALKGAPESTLTLSAGAGIASGVVAGIGLSPGIDVRLRHDEELFGPIDELMGSLSARDARSTGSGFRQSELELRVGAGHRFFVSRLSLSLGLEVGALLVLQNDLPDHKPRAGMGPSAQLVFEARLPIIRPVELYLLGTGGGAVLRKVSGVFLAPRVAASAGVALVF